MTSLRQSPYVWVTWITGLLSQEDNCEWAAWFRAHHFFEKRHESEPFDVVTFTRESKLLQAEQAEQLRAQGYQVTVEAPNGFKLVGSDGTMLAGVPDLLAVRDQEALVVDTKTGADRLAHQFQVLVYMTCLPTVQPALKGKVLSGRVWYTHGAVDVPASALNDDFRANFRATMNRIGGHTAPAKSPSYSQCRFCNIGKWDCPERIDMDQKPVSATELF